MKSPRSRCRWLLLVSMTTISCATGRLAAPADALDWDAVATKWFALVRTTDPGGELRETRVVFVVVEDAGFVRTGSTRWFRNLETSPDFELRVGSRVYAVRAELVDDEETERAIDAAFRAKYGLGDWLADWFRPRDRNVLRITERRSDGSSRSECRWPIGAPTLVRAAGS